MLRRRKQRQLTPEPSPARMTDVVAWEAKSGSTTVVSSVSSQMTSLGPVLLHRPSAASRSEAQLGAALSTSEARSLSRVRMADPLEVATPSATSTSVAVADEATVVELKGIIGRLCSENRGETVRRLRAQSTRWCRPLWMASMHSLPRSAQLSPSEQRAYSCRSANF